MVRGSGALLLLMVILRCPAQTTDGVISGRVVNAQTGDPLDGAQIEATRLTSSLDRNAIAGSSGFFALPLLSPGTYRVRVTAGQAFQPQEVQELELPVAGHLFLLVKLRPINDVWEQKQHQSVFLPNQSALVLVGPDVDTSRTGSFEATTGSLSAMETSVSYVIDEGLIESLPLLGRDVYSLLVLLPAVTADTTTARGINLSVAGQRPSSSNFLLDGLEYNNYLITGPLAATIPESIQEYRISTNNYSAEYGRTSGFVANAVTRNGENAWHGSAFALWNQDALNANGFQENTNGIPRAPLRRAEPGAALGGPLIHHRLFSYTSVDVLRFHSQADPETFLLPTRQFIASTNPTSPAGSLLRQYGSIAPDVPLPDDFERRPATLDAPLTIQPPTGLHRDSTVERMDYDPSTKLRMMGRASYAEFLQPNLLYNPYPGFSSGLSERALSLALSGTYSLSPSWTNEARIGRDGSRYSFERPHDNIPRLQTENQVWLPGSQAYYGYGDRDHTWEALDNVVVAYRRHILKLGGGWLWRGIESGLSADASGEYTFPSLKAFAASIPDGLYLTYERSAGDAFTQPRFDRAYRYQQAYGFIQDSYQVSRKMSLNFGLRYEFFGAPFNVGQVKDTLVQLGAGSTLPQRLSTASFVTPGPGDERIYSSQTGYWAPRFAFAWDPTGSARTVVRGGYGIYYDRPFDNFWQTVAANSLMFGYTTFNQRVNFLQPAHSLVNCYVPANTPIYPCYGPSTAPIYLALFQPKLRNGAVQDSFLELDHSLSPSISLEFLGAAALGRTLPTNDLVNRDDSVDFQRFDPELPPLYYRANQGKSDYTAFSSVLKFRGRRVQGQVSYTLSHAIDNQSDPLAGAFLDYNFRPDASSGPQTFPAFTRQFDSQFDRANADFDQRHNVVFYLLGDIPSTSRGRSRQFLKDWRIGVLAAFRSGFPYTAIAQPIRGIGPYYENNRANLVTAVSPVREDVPVPGGDRLLNPLAFAQPAPGLVGDTGRNVFSGPGLYSVDMSLMREFALPGLGESRRIQIRADAFNILNHANLNNPVNTMACSGCNQFAIAFYGRVESSGSPLMQPLVENGRQIQLMVRFEF